MTTTATEPVDGARRSHPLQTILRWAVFLVVSWLVLRPVLITAIVADDFLIPAYQYSVGGASFVESLHIGWRGASSGHFNFAGQIIGAIVGWVWVQGTFNLGINFSFIFATTKFIVYLATALAAARFFRVAAAEIGTELSPWRSRAYVAVALFGTLQIHVAWSNDPTVNYPMSGFASTALAFWVLSLAVPRLLNPTLRGSVEVCALATFSVLYYEVNAALVVAFTPLIAVSLLKDRRWRSVRDLFYAGLPIAFPAAVVVVLRTVTKPAPEDTYNGTALAAETMVGTFKNAVISTLPASAWKLTRDWMGAPFTLRVIPLGVLVLCAILGAELLRRYPQHKTPPPTSRLTALGLAGTVVVYWLGTAAIQAATPKIQSESKGIGYVYNYYAAGATCFAVAVAAFAVFVYPRLPKSIASPIAILSVAVLAVQMFITTNMMLRFNEVTLPNQRVYASYANDQDEQTRCQALHDWLQGSWPIDYRMGLVNGMQWAHEEYRGEPYCERLLGETGKKPDNVG